MPNATMTDGIKEIIKAEKLKKSESLNASVNARELVVTQREANVLLREQKVDLVDMQYKCEKSKAELAERLVSLLCAIIKLKYSTDGEIPVYEPYGGNSGGQHLTKQFSTNTTVES